MTLIDALLIVAVVLVLFVVHTLFLTPKKNIETDIAIDSRLIATSDDDLTDPKKIAYIVYKSIAIDLKKKVDQLEQDVSSLTSFRNVFSFYVATIGFALGIISFYLKVFSP